MNGDNRLMEGMIVTLQLEIRDLDTLLSVIRTQPLQYSAIERQAWRLKEAIAALNEAIEEARDE